MKSFFIHITILFCVFSFGLTTDAQAKRKWSKTRPEINLTHIFQGEINRRHKPTGFHSRPHGKDPKHARLVKIMSPPNKAGVYTARVEIWDKKQKRWKKKFSSFFPDSMNRKQVIKAIVHAYNHRYKREKRPWRGPSGHGFYIQGYVTGRGGINTAFPVYKK